MSGAPPVLSLFAKTPTPGRVKTRLHGHLDPYQAARVAEDLLRATVHRACVAWPGPVELLVWPDPDHPAFDDLVARYSIRVRRQASGHLGRKMLQALEPSIRTAGAGAVMGSDVPHCPERVLRQAAAALRAGENVIGPTEDGGFYLLGLIRTCASSLLDGIAWGDAAVFRDTVTRLGAAGIPVDHLLPVLRDIDTWDDLRFALQHTTWLRDFVSADAMLTSGQS